MTTRGAIATAVVQAFIVAAAVAVAQAARWRERRRQTPTFDLPAPREPRVIDLTTAEQQPAQQHC